MPIYICKTPKYIAKFVAFGFFEETHIKEHGRLYFILHKVENDIIYHITICGKIAIVVSLQSVSKC